MNVELSNIHKHFGAVHANDGISLTIPAGTIQGILGENGAGKSTLMKILSGFHPGRLAARSCWMASRSSFIPRRMPSSTGSACCTRTRWISRPCASIDNFLLGRRADSSPTARQPRRISTSWPSEFGFTIDPEAYVDSLTVGERQQLEILRLLWLGARVLILDEPTTGISAAQKDKLFATLKQLAANRAMTVMFVSHKLEDVEGLCDRVAVLRQGRAGRARPSRPTSRAQLVEMMFGKEVTLGARAILPRRAMPCSR
ncbi:MAG: ATP-binding cassette domain-containing protein [Candidatus Moduliflexus flocculans]|nr:ATP-binding cassette domain-containing protein [Candidatus Moduliflexus flocculans]